MIGVGVHGAVRRELPEVGHASDVDGDALRGLLGDRRGSGQRQKTGQHHEQGQESLFHCFVSLLNGSSS